VTWPNSIVPTWRPNSATFFGMRRSWQTSWVSLNDIAQQNVDKLPDRQRLAVLDGFVDNR